MDVRVELSRKLSTEKLMLLNCGVGEDSWESLGQIQSAHPKGNQSWVFIGSTDAEADTTGLPDAKSRLIEKDPNAGKDWGQEEKGVTENKMIRCHHQLNGHEFEQALGVMKDREAWGAAVHGVKESNTICQLNNEGSIMQLGTKANRTFSMSQLWVSV